MKTSLSIISLIALGALAGCGDDDDSTPPPVGGEAGESSGGSMSTAGTTSVPTAGTSGEAGADTGGSTTGGTTGTAGTTTTGGTETGGTTSTGGTTGEAGMGGEGGEGPQAFYQCQGSDQQFVRRAIQGVLGRRPSSQAEVNMYTDLIAEVDAMDGVDPEELPAEFNKPLRHSRKVVLSALFQSPDYLTNWDELYRDFMRVQRVDEYSNASCFGAKARNGDQVDVAKFVRDNPADGGGDGGPAPTMADVILGSLMLDDVTPMYTANLFAMLVKTYAGANGTAIESEIGRRRDFGAWFDGVYLNRDPVCLTCHNSEFSVTQTADEATNRHFPIPALLEKALLGASTGHPVEGSFDANDFMHGGLKYARFTSNCTFTVTQTQIDNAVAAGTIPPDMCGAVANYRECRTASSIGPRDIVCQSTIAATRAARPWGLSTNCGQFMDPNAIPLDLAGVNTKFGNVTGLRASAWDMSRTLRAGFEKLRTQGLGADPVTHEVADPDKAFAYMTVMTLVEKVWKEITGSGLTITTYFPRNAASRDQLQHLTDTFIASGYSNKALLEDIFASPYLNLAPPESECWAGGYELPRIFDPWVTGEEDPVKRNNSVGDGTFMLSSRTAARSTYGSLGWRLWSWGSSFPNQSGATETSQNIIGTNPLIATGPLERQFQEESGFFSKSTALGFRGFDFQARLGFEDRFARCQKLYPLTGERDVIDELVYNVRKPGTGTVKDVIDVLKDRFFGDVNLSTAEQAGLEAILGKGFDADASELTEAPLRRVCGVLAAAPQALMTTVGVVPPDATTVPKLTPGGATYNLLCDTLATRALPDGLTVTCSDDAPLTVAVSTPAP